MQHVCGQEVGLCSRKKEKREEGGLNRKSTRTEKRKRDFINVIEGRKWTIQRKKKCSGIILERERMGVSGGFFERLGYDFQKEINLCFRGI